MPETGNFVSTHSVYRQFCGGVYRVLYQRKIQFRAGAGTFHHELYLQGFDGFFDDARDLCGALFYR